MKFMKPKIKIFTIHFAGGNCYSYRKFDNYSLEQEFIHLELPGRGKRMDEELILDSNDAVDEVVNQILNHSPSSNFIIFGHSMGALLAYGAASKLSDIGMVPKAIVVSGNPGPEIKRNNELSSLPKELFIEELSNLGGIPKEILDNEDAIDFFLPIIRADFKISECFNFSPMNKLEVPIHAVMGDVEGFVDDIDNWKRFTNSKFEKTILSGGHFFINDHVNEMVKIIGSVC